MVDYEGLPKLELMECHPPEGPTAPAVVAGVGTMGAIAKDLGFAQSEVILSASRDSHLHSLALAPGVSMRQVQVSSPRLSE